MSQLMLFLIDQLLLILHLLVIFINVLGWWPRRTRPLQRWTLLLTGFSWLGCGAFYGWGYCFLTDWHWDIKRARGELDIPRSFLQYVLQKYLGVYLPNNLVDTIAATVLVLVLLITILQIFRARFRGKKETNSDLSIIR